MSTASIKVGNKADVHYLLRVADACLILSQRLGEWCGHGPILEEDLALSNMALDLVGQARGLLTRAGQLDGQGHDEDQLAFLRDERQYFNPVLMELPNSASGNSQPGDFALTQLRNFAVATWLQLLWHELQSSSDAEVAAIAAKAVKEARYHQQHAADWVVRLGDGTDESAARMRAALALLWPYFNELFADDAVSAAAAAQGLGPQWSTLQPQWQAQMNEILAEAGLSLPKPSAYVPSGRLGIHSEHMGHLLAEMQYLQRAYPGGKW
ncbi:ring-1,2-phenylacetyl-CoA epoxidase subunit PaaC [Paucibacter oligotrophus]|uniref:Ring-1,2-phenylacetyl-CoA epoxidase subunit PaaC n=1 Tax=Roseateles oligotrophus TaxID=1769250 RepID=A0A840L9E7_9BURK|nr:1,2-phenylacetyl-CoA epoxidase subunit PaaC [Roseateles oligotrophus]MBB4841997.1 ring-1,2-phenylacetyl-CoA epoxidase subunit PaaC [Roseateles oligotrophus]